MLNTKNTGKGKTMSRKKAKILKEFKEAVIELKQVETGIKKSRPAREFINELREEERRGGFRPGAGAKPKNQAPKKGRQVNLTDTEYKHIVKTFGTFAAGVRSLLVPDEDK